MVCTLTAVSTMCFPISSSFIDTKTGFVFFAPWRLRVRLLWVTQRREDAKFEAQAEVGDIFWITRSHEATKGEERWIRHKFEEIRGVAWDMGGMVVVWGPDRKSLFNGVPVGKDGGT